MDVVQPIAEAEKEGWFAPEFTKRFLESFSGLDIVPRQKSHIEFFCDYGNNMDESLENWQNQHRIKLFCVGLTDILFVLLGDNKIIYLTDGSDIWKFGDNFSESLDNLFFVHFIEENFKAEHLINEFNLKYDPR